MIASNILEYCTILLSANAIFFHAGQVLRFKSSKHFENKIKPDLRKDQKLEESLVEHVSMMRGVRH